ncbi:MAG: glycosyltransferase family 2 protein [Acidobacteria bacterium]|nr:glycosyltransferase family 2 protein [Acidobacteriota bacterium]
MVGSVVSALRQRYVHVVVVDDGSSDDTASVAAGAGAITLRHCINRGQGAALQTGLSYSLQCGAHCIVTFDADGQHDHRDIEALTRPILTGEVDVALGSRFVGSGSAEGLPWSRRLLLKTAVMFTRVISRARVTDTHNGLRAFSRRAAERLNLSVDRMGHASEIIDQVSAMGLPYTEVPVHIRYTEYSRLKGQTDLGAVSVLAGYLLGRLRR